MSIRCKQEDLLRDVEREIDEGCENSMKDFAKQGDGGVFLNFGG